MSAVFADMHDGDMKHVSIKGTSITITPSGNDQSWTVKGELTLVPGGCSGLVDFNVTGKPNPPPVKLVISPWDAFGPKKAGTVQKKTLEFVDPSGKLAPKNEVVNSWVQLGEKHSSQQREECSPANGPASLVYRDMHDGDYKQVSLSGDTLTITPSGNQEKWLATATFDYSTCQFIVDFNVPGKPKPPPVNLTMKLWDLGPGKPSWEFTDPSGVIWPIGYPLNEWIPGNPTDATLIV